MQSFNQVLADHLTNIERIARKITGRFTDTSIIEGLISTGSAALWQASKVYKTGRQTSLWQFAYKSVRGSMIDELRKMDHLSRDTRRKVNEHDIDHLSWALLFPCDLETTIYPDDKYDPEKTLIQQERELMGLQALDCLRDNERRVIHKYYFDDLILVDIAQELGISESRVCQIKRSALSRLRNYITNGFIEPPKKPVIHHHGKRGSRILILNGREMPLYQWAQEVNLKPGIISGRLAQGWSVEKTLTTPVRPWKRTP
jgi:RNA polymerase sigma factor for flagellar operon FliA